MGRCANRFDSLGRGTSTIVTLRLAPPHIAVPCACGAIRDSVSCKCRSMEYRVCAVADFPVGSRRLIRAGRRNVAIYHHRGRYYALDNACYHHGGPLLNGDIEDVGGRPCVRCPWHSYKITLDSGEGLYFGVELESGRDPKPVLKSKGVKQRVHEVFVRNGDVFCLVKTAGQPCASDEYAEMEIANREQPTPITGRGTVACGPTGLHSSLVDPGRSGSVLAIGNSVDLDARDRRSLVRVHDSEPACDQGKTRRFTFCRANAAAANDRRRIVPGMWVRLRLPIGGAGKFEDRQWTVTKTRGGQGAWFSVTVRLRERGAGGSRWLFSHDAQTVAVELVEIGGTFTFHHLREKINECRGKVLLVSAGIGITPFIGSLLSHASDPFATTSGPPLHVVHLHSDALLSAIASGSDLMQLHAQYSLNDLRTTPFSYRMFAHITQENTSNLRQPIPCVNGRISQQHVADAVRSLGEPGPECCVVAMICGPDPFTASMIEHCAVSGIPGNAIFTESFD